jgi:aspartyl/asparaginyl beta-hydroxylase (cupin superfamily)
MWKMAVFVFVFLVLTVTLTLLSDTLRLGTQHPFQTLKKHVHSIRNEALGIHIVNDKVRNEHVWGQDISTIRKHYNENQSWSIAWDPKIGWLEYPLVIHGEYVGKAAKMCPITCQLLKPYLKHIGVAAFSLLKANRHIKRHKDYETEFLYNYHLGLTGDAVLTYYSKNSLIQKTTKRQHFGSEYVFIPSRHEHEVQNGNEDRIILLINFSK